MTTNAKLLASIDTHLARDLLPRHLSTHGERSVTCAIAHVDRDSVVVVAVAGIDERTGGLAIIAPETDSVLDVEGYPAARELSAAGNRRIVFTYTEARELAGAGIYESDYVVLCGVSREMWLPCLKLTRDEIHNVMATRVPMRLEQHNVAVLVGDSLRYTRRTIAWVDGVRDSAAEALGTVMMALPRLP